MELEKIFSNRLNTYLAENDLTQKEFAKKCGIAQGSIWTYLHGTIPTGKMLFHIAQICDVSIDWLFGLDDMNFVKNDIKNITVNLDKRKNNKKR